MFCGSEYISYVFEENTVILSNMVDFYDFYILVLSTELK